MSMVGPMEPLHRVEISRRSRSFIHSFDFNLLRHDCRESSGVPAQLPCISGGEEVSFGGWGPGGKEEELVSGSQLAVTRCHLVTYHDSHLLSQLERPQV